MFATAALSNGAAEAGRRPPSLDQTALTEPETISNWLAQHAATADRQTAERYFDVGVKAQNQSNWSRAAKAFGESALFFPGPAALQGYADNTLRDLGKLRRRTNDDTQAVADLSRALKIYRSALAADAQTRTLTAPVLAKLKADEACLDKHIAKGAGKGAERTTAAMLSEAGAQCRPLLLYGG
jgi:hypothetical protein